MEVGTKKFLEMFIVLFVLVVIVHAILYKFYFDDLCKSYSGNNKASYLESIYELATCKDSYVCELKDIEVEDRNISNSWSCVKKETGYLGINVAKNFINSIIK